MVKPVDISEMADLEAVEAVRWYKKRDERVAVDFAEEFAATIQLIGERSTIFATHLLGTRRCQIGRFPWQIIFREELGRIEVVAVAHFRRKPGYWKRRLR
jgi:plasmid stabilization system protein ParE